jgi:hypothetical protein
MSNIKEILYKEIDPSIYSSEEASQFQFLYNMMDCGYADEYEEFEKKQLEVRNHVLVDSLSEQPNPHLPSVVIGMSDITKNVILICE